MSKTLKPDSNSDNKVTIYQQITIHQLRVNNVMNSSVLQIGSAGQFHSLSNLYNTGGFTSPAPEITEAEAEASETWLVPLAPPQ